MPSLTPAELAARAARVRLLLLDVDGVLTDGSIIYTDRGVELKRFHVRDGSGLKLWRQAGNRAAILSGRSSRAVEIRAAELGIAPVFQGREDKRLALADLRAEAGVGSDEVCVVGDDLPDLPLFSLCALAVAVADAAPEVRAAADYVTAVPGGRGAARDAIEWLLKLQGKWAYLVGRFQSAG